MFFLDFSHGITHLLKANVCEQDPLKHSSMGSGQSGKRHGHGPQSHPSSGPTQPRTKDSDVAA